MVPMVPFSRLLTALRDVADPRRAGQALSAARSFVVHGSGADERGALRSRHRHLPGRAPGASQSAFWRGVAAGAGGKHRATKSSPALRTVLQSLDSQALERAFRHHAKDLLSTVAADGDGRPVIALKPAPAKAGGKIRAKKSSPALRGSFDHLNDKKAAQTPAFAGAGS